MRHLVLFTFLALVSVLPSFFFGVPSREKRDLANAFERGQGALDREDLDSAIANFTAVTTGDPKHVLAYYCRGNAYDMKGQTEEAIADYSEAIRVRPDFWEAYNNRGSVYLQTADYQKAIDDFKHAIRLSPQSPPPYNNLAWIFATCPKAESRDGPKAIEYVQKACKLSNWEVGIGLDTLAAAFAETENFEEAIKWQEKALRSAPKGKEQEWRKRLQLYHDKMAYRAQ